MRSGVGLASQCGPQSSAAEPFNLNSLSGLDRSYNSIHSVQMPLPRKMDSAAVGHCVCSLTLFGRRDGKVDEGFFCWVGRFSDDIVRTVRPECGYKEGC